MLTNEDRTKNQQVGQDDKGHGARGATPCHKAAGQVLQTIEGEVELSQDNDTDLDEEQDTAHAQARARQVQVATRNMNGTRGEEQEVQTEENSDVQTAVTDAAERRQDAQKKTKEEVVEKNQPS